MTYKILDDGVERDATPEEVAEIEARRAEADVNAPRMAILSEIATLEDSNPVTHRALREMAIGTFEVFNELIGYINALEARIAALENPGNPSPNPAPSIPASYGVQVANAINERIAELRAQL